MTIQKKSRNNAQESLGLTFFQTSLFTFLFTFLFIFTPISFSALILFPTQLFAQASPTIGYAVPAGGERGTTFHVILGGRQIQGAEEVCFSCPGVSARILKRFPSMAMRVTEASQPARTLYREEFSVAKAPLEQQAALREEMLQKRRERLANPQKTEDEKALLTPEELANRFPWFEELLTQHRPEDIQRVYWEYFFERPDSKPKETLSQGLLLEVTIAPDAPCGDQFLSLRLPNLQTDPILFQIGDIPEVLELEPNDTTELPKRWNRETKQMEAWAFVQLPTAQLPVLFNGQIRPGDVDRFRFEAKKGQKLVLSAVGRRLNPYLADAVPGWFQPILRLFGPNGLELGNACCWRNDPDPVLILDAPEDGVYSVEIQDSLFRGRDDFVYRLAIGELPWIRTLYPPCAERGKPFQAHAEGVNLPTEKVLIADPVGAPNWDGVPMMLLGTLNSQPLLHPVGFTVENEAPQEAQAEQEIQLPAVFYGKLEHRGQTAEFRFNGKKGEQITVDVTASDLDSPLDARLEMLDASGKQIAQNDDRAGADGPNIGLRTHHCDPLLNVTLPEDGAFRVRLSNTLYEENPANVFRIRIARAEPAFQIFAVCRAVAFTSASQCLELELVRLQGFKGAVEIVSEDPNLEVSNGLIPEGATRGMCILTARADFWPQGLGETDPKEVRQNLPLPLHARAVGANAETTPNVGIRTAMRREQAFIYHHLLPTGSLTASFRGKRKLPFELITETPVTLKREGETEIVFCPEGTKQKNWKPKNWTAPGRWLVLSPSCEGLEIVSIREEGPRWFVNVRVTDPEKAAACQTLIFEIHWFKAKFQDPAPDSGLTPEQVRMEPTLFIPPEPSELGRAVGWLPAVPVKLEPLQENSEVKP